MPVRKKAATVPEQPAAMEKTAVQDVASHTPRTMWAAKKNPARYGERVRNEANMRTADKPAENDAVGLPSSAKCTV